LNILVPKLVFLDEHSLAPFGDAGSRRFFISKATGTASGRTRKLKSIIGKLQSAFEYEASYSKRDVPISEKQAHRLKIQPHQRISPYLTECCLRASANVSYENAAQDVVRYTGMTISGKTQPFDGVLNSQTNRSKIKNFRGATRS